MIGHRLTAGWRTRHRNLTGTGSGDAGTTLLELSVAMIIMTIAGSIFVGAIVTLYRVSDEAQAVTTSAQQNNQAYQTLDRTVQYASAISQPGQGAGTGDWYVEVRNTTDGTERCSQLRVDIVSGKLQRRTWTPSVSTTPSTWFPLTSGVTNGTATLTSINRPFILTTPRRQVLTVSITTRAGSVSAPTSSQSRYALTALNSPVATIGSTTTSPVCPQVRP